MEVFDVLIIGGGVSGVSCAQVLGSAVKKPFAADKKIGIIMHQKASMLQDAVFYNAYGVKQGTLGCDLLSQSIEDLKYYSHINQILEEKVISVLVENDVYKVTTNKQEYFTKIVVVAVNSSATFSIEGLLDYVEPHNKSLASKNRIQLKNIDHFVTEGIYVVGTLAGHRSQLAIAAGSGAAVATDILTLWNDGIETHSHDSNRVK
ncbi:NAD(P)/FAD-dependent oxidoreductase [Myroides marinus]|uniref:FAD-dependent oxidoreductase n=1 Tax=Myroides marinus TaxID=703342 RepID=UPI002576027F|nr:FAD-dependent oxidoreductase [Myroides marinus]MDM1347091.1 NAD(P)/FAD-dependent oxidoreductase [Myroides marinus]MDM1350610.1 NAD(P)/FAD-dependent oxidoreductase [Myroides marinus]MDM1354330.1 NAD(P)/FAD-dependent oxidoreductase [Myroides marinus]MDM1357817.1 NAD(P)/FAD-dependent oxidoreductase [Myroides marinus]MDM1365249.1 NAD(P)/FAD-dependent oxidoreductase [Myroides marinus]